MRNPCIGLNLVSRMDDEEPLIDRGTFKTEDPEALKIIDDMGDNEIEVFKALTRMHRSSEREDPDAIAEDIRLASGGIAGFKVDDLFTSLCAKMASEVQISEAATEHAKGVAGVLSKCIDQVREGKCEQGIMTLPLLLDRPAEFFSRDADDMKAALDSVDRSVPPFDTAVFLDKGKIEDAMVKSVGTDTFENLERALTPEMMFLQMGRWAYPDDLVVIPTPPDVPALDTLDTLDTLDSGSTALDSTLTVLSSLDSGSQGRCPF